MSTKRKGAEQQGLDYRLLPLQYSLTWGFSYESWQKGLMQAVSKDAIRIEQKHTMPDALTRTNGSRR